MLKILKSIFFKSTSFDEDIRKEVNKLREQSEERIKQYQKSYRVLTEKESIVNSIDFRAYLNSIKKKCKEFTFKEIKKGNKIIKFHYFNNDTISIHKEQIKLIQIVINDIQFLYESESEFWNSAQKDLQDNCEIITLTKSELKKEKINVEELTNLNKHLTLSDSFSLPSYHILEEYSLLATASSVTLGNESHFKNGNDYYNDVAKEIIGDFYFKNQIGGFPYWEDIFLESKYSFSPKEVDFICQYKFKNIEVKNYIPNVNIFFFYDNNNEKIFYEFNFSLTENKTTHNKGYK